MKPTVLEIVSCAAQAFRIEAHHIMNGDRSDLHCRPRFAVCLIAHDLGYSHPQIGRALGGRDHTSIINACKRARVFAAEDPEYLELLEEVRAAACRDRIPFFKSQRSSAV